MEVYVEESTLEEPAILEDEQFKTIRSQLCFKKGNIFSVLFRYLFYGSDYL